VRAVGFANGSNPISIVIPCHRLIGADGSLTGYGGGLERKRWLLEHEGVRCRRRSRSGLLHSAAMHKTATSSAAPCWSRMREPAAAKQRAREKTAVHGSPAGAGKSLSLDVSRGAASRR
jgi:hypothetical protein